MKTPKEQITELMMGKTIEEIERNNTIVEQALLIKKLERELAAANQIMGELCESCGWAMRFPDQPCRCELEAALAAVKGGSHE
jgi:hypothetical protein